MARLLETTVPQSILWLAVLALVFAVGSFLIVKVRRRMRADGPLASELLTNFRDLHSKGELSDEEYRTIKSMLAERLEGELTGSGEEG